MQVNGQEVEGGVCFISSAIDEEVVDGKGSRGVGGVCSVSFCGRVGYGLTGRVFSGSRSEV